MAVHTRGSDEPGLNGKKPQSTWMADDGLSIVCPFCGIEKQSDDRLGRHFVHDHWREIEFATKRVRDMDRHRN